MASWSIRKYLAFPSLAVSSSGRLNSIHSFSHSTMFIVSTIYASSNDLLF